MLINSPVKKLKTNSKKSELRKHISSVAECSINQGRAHEICSLSKIKINPRFFISYDENKKTSRKRRKGEIRKLKNLLNRGNLSNQPSPRAAQLQNFNKQNKILSSSSCSKKRVPKKNLAGSFITKSKFLEAISQLLIPT